MSSSDDWIMGALAAQDKYKPVPEGVWLPDVGAPAIPSGPQWPGTEWGNRAATALTAGIPHDPNSPVVYRTASPLVNFTQQDLDTGMDLALGFSGGGLATRAVKARTAPGAILNPTPANIPRTVPEQIDTSGWINAPYLTDPQRILKPGVYKDPRVIAAEANARVAPENPAMKDLFGVTRQDLYDISQQGTRQGNVAPNIWQPKKPGGSYAAENIMNPENAQRLIDTLTEARKYPGLEQGMVPWYVMDPAYQRLVQLVGPERAIGEYNKFNMMMTPFSASSDVLKEINRGTGARMMAEKGRFPEFAQHAVTEVAKRGPDFPPEMAAITPHPYSAIQTDPAGRYALTGQHGYGQETVKIPLYTQASGVPETGFQTAWPVPDAHFTRAVGMSDVRKNAKPGEYMGGSEYRTMAPWFRENVAKPLGIEAVPTQALTWGAYAPQTGVKTPIGAGKLELFSQRIMERARELGVDPKWLRDEVLLGRQHSALEPDNQGMGSLAANA